MARAAPEPIPLRVVGLLGSLPNKRPTCLDEDEVTCILAEIRQPLQEDYELPLIGEPFRLMYVRDFAFANDTDSLEDLVEQCFDLAHRHGCNFLSFVLEAADSAIFLLAKHKPVKTTFRIYARSLEGKALSNPTKMYIDPADLWHVSLSVCRHWRERNKE